VFVFLIIGILFTGEYPLVIICVMAGVAGFLSDIFNISPKIRLILYVAVSVALVASYAGFLILSGSAAAVLLFIFLIIFVAGSANIYNFMDGINGIASVTAVIAFGLAAFFSFGEGPAVSGMTILSICIAVSCMGFLPFNVPKARIFMGDVGSIFLGFTFAGMTVLLSKNALDFICMASFLFTFYADEIVTMCLRVKDGQNLLIPHRRHFYQILANEGRIPHWKVSFGYGTGQLVIGLSVLLLRPLGVWAVAGALSFYFVVFVVMNNLVRRKFAALM